MDKGRYESDSNVFTRRSALIMGAQAGVMGLLLGRLYQLQVAQADKYETLAEANRVNVRPVAAARGRILDRAGRVLAANDRKLMVDIIPEQADDIEQTIENLVILLELSEAQRRDIEYRIRRSPPFRAVTVAKNIDWQKFARLNLQLPFLRGVFARVGEQRIYHYGEDTAHLIGYVGAKTRADLREYGNISADAVGRTGIEKLYEVELRGKAGLRRLEVNAFGRTVRELASDNSRPGRDITLTLHAPLQSFSRKSLRGHSGSLVVMDVQNGDILAMISTPSFDPNKMIRGIDERDWNNMLGHERKPLMNKALRGLYAPGSTFKMLVMLAALENGVIDESFTVNCTGQFDYGNEVYHCWRPEGHGQLGLVQAVAQSCDSFFYELALRTGIDNLEKMAKKFGLGALTGLQVRGEKTGIVPSRDWKRANYETAWRSGETVITGIGQGYLLATPLQLTCMIAALANGGRKITPRVTHMVPAVPPQNLGLSPKNMELIKNALYAVVNQPDGTAYSSSLLIKGARMAGKTGTVQVRRISLAEREAGIIPNEELDWHLRDHSLFVGYAPHNKPRYAIAVVVEHGGGGAQVAAPIARDVMVQLLRNPPAILPEDDEAHVEVSPQQDAGGAG